MIRKERMSNPPEESIFKPYERLMQQWYQDYPMLKASQLYERHPPWLEVRFPWGVVYGFAMILAHSRYLYVRFYPRQTLEFFLEGHLEAFREMGGVAHQHGYDNIKSGVIKRSPELKLNAKFLDFASPFAFSIHLCNPYRANEKGRIERALRDLRDGLRINTLEEPQRIPSESQSLENGDKSEIPSSHWEGS